jgi:hypothetical protein
MALPLTAAEQPRQRIEAKADDPLLHRDQSIVRDLNVFRAYLSTAFSDVAEP